MKLSFLKKWFVILILLILTGYFALEHFQQTKKPYQCSIQFLPSSNKYFIEAEINKNKEFLLLDTGSFSFLTLDEDILNKIPNKQEIGEQNWLDINGNQYNSKVFKLDAIGFETFKVNDILAEEVNHFFSTQGGRVRPDLPMSKAVKKEKKRLSGSIGIKLFRNHDYWYIDLFNKYFFPIKDQIELENFLNTSKQKFIEIPIEENESHVIISIETDFGVKRLCLDTGANQTILQAIDAEGALSCRQFAWTKKFVANDYDFGEVEVYFFDFPRKDFDGLLGVDFLGKHPFLFDFKNNRVFIGKGYNKNFFLKFLRCFIF